MTDKSTFTCDSCQQTFPKGWSDEEAVEEHQQNFGRPPDEDAAVICDDCYEALMERLRS